MPPIDVFVSYNGKDRDVAKLLTEKLRNSSLKPWLDIEQLPSGQSWSPEIRRVIKSAPAVFFLIGPHGLGDWQKRELRVCQEQRLRGLLLVPIILPGGQEASYLPWVLRDLSWLSLTEGLPQSEIAHLVTLLRDHTNDPRSAGKTVLNADPAGTAQFKPRNKPTKQKAFALEHLIAHLAQTGDSDRLFKLLETHEFLAEKSNFFGVFQPAIRDLEQYILPTTTEREDWKRFLFYSMISKNLRGLSATLGTPRVVRLLLDNGQQALAEDIAALSPPDCRPQLLAILAAGLEDSDPKRSAFIRSIGEGISDLSKPTDLSSAQYRARLLSSVGSHLGLELLTAYERHLDSLRPWPELEDSIWMAAARGYLERGLEWYSYFWESVRRIENTSNLLSFLPRSVIWAPEPMPPDQVRDDLEFLTNHDHRIFWHTWLAALARKAGYDPKGCLELWEGFPDKRSVPWSSELIELGRDFLACFTPDKIDDLCAEMQIEEQVALRIVILEAAPNLQRAEESFWALQELPWSAERVHWALRYLLARPADPLPQARMEVLALLSRLSGSLKELPSPDATLVLDLIARYQPNDLPARLKALTQEIIPSSRLLEIAQSSRSAAVLEAIRGHIAPLQHRDEINKVTCLKLCELWGNLNFLDSALPHLDGDAADQFCLQVAYALVEKGYLKLARGACERIVEPGMRLRAMLSVLPSDLVPSDLLTPSKLYEAAASARACQQELALLTALLEENGNPDEIVKRYLTAVNDQRYTPSSDFLHSPLRLQRDLSRSTRAGTPIHSVSPTTRALRKHLLGLIDSPRGMGGELRKFDIATRASSWIHQVVNRPEVSWSSKLQTIEWSLEHIASEHLDMHPHRRSHRSFASVLESIARIPTEIGNPETHKAIRARWHEIFPILVAFAERYSEEVGIYLRKGSFESLSLHALRLWPSVLFRRTTTHFRNGFVMDRWAKYLVDEHHASRSPLPPRQMEVIDLCLGNLEARERKARSLLLQDNADPTILRSLAVLLARDRPKLVEDIVENLAAEDLRDDLCVALIRGDWLPHEYAIRVHSHIASEAIALEARVWLELRSPTEGDAWLESFASLIGYYGAEPSDPGFRSVLERIWRDEPGEIRGALAEAVLIALASGDHIRTEAALLFWIHGFLATNRRSPDSPLPTELIDCMNGSLSL